MPKPINGDGGGPTNTEIEQQLQLLRDIQVIKFTASPASVQPFQDTTVSYQVKLPTTLKVPVTFSVATHNFAGALSGSTSFPITANTTFGLRAATSITGLDIATTVVTVDQAACVTGSIPGFGITGTIKGQVDSAFTGRLSGTGSTVTLGAGLISIAIPVNLGSGKGTMNIAVAMPVMQSGESVTVGDQSVTVSIHLDTDLNVGSWCSNAMQDLVQPFMQHIVDSEIVPAVTQGIMNQINMTITSAEQADRTHRTFALTSFALTSDGATFLVCPTTPAVLPPGSVTTKAGGLATKRV